MGHQPAAVTLRDHTAGQPAVPGLLAWQVLSQQWLEPWREVETRHVTATPAPPSGLRGAPGPQQEPALSTPGLSSALLIRPEALP